MNRDPMNRDPINRDPVNRDPINEDSLGYEQARDELIDVVRRLEAGGVSLAESLALWERGEKLAEICQEWLDGARARLAKATAEEPTGAPTGESADRPPGGLPRVV